MIYFTADTHFYHRNIIKYCNRPFVSLDQMHRTIIDNFNSVLTSDDILYHVGDVGLGPAVAVKELLDSIVCKEIIFVMGNHDSKKKIEYWGGTAIKGIDLEHNDNIFLIKHVPLYAPTYKAVISGHHHEKYRINGNIFNVGVDVNDFKPVSIETIIDLVGFAKDLVPLK